MTEIQTRVEDVGHILVKVQDDLRQLREKMAAGEGNITAAEVEKALAKTEEGLQRHTEEIVYHLNNRVQMLPLDGVDENEQYYPTESVQELYNVEYRRPTYAPDRVLLKRQPLPPGVKLPLRKMMQMQGLTPGQKHQQQLALRNIINPQNQMNRNVMKESYGIQLPLINDKRVTRPPLKPILGSTVEHLTVLPKANRVDASLAPPPIEEEDARKGILSLLERGLIPPAALLTLDPSPIKNKTLQLYSSEDKLKLQHIHDSNPSSWALMKMEPKPEESQPPLPQIPVIKGNKSPEARNTSAKTWRSSSASNNRYLKTPASVKTYEMPLQPYPPPTTPASGDYKQTSHRFAIQNGKTRDTQPEYLAFKEHYSSSWGSIVSMIKNLEKMLSLYSVPIAFISGDKLADLALEYELEKSPGIAEMLCVIINREDVEAIINKPGRKYMGANGRVMAATKIQSLWRRYRERSQYLEYRRLKWAAGVIAISWIMRIKMAKMRHQLRQTRLDQLEAFKRRSKKFAASWDRIKNSRRVIIHVPSLGFSQSIRESIPDLGMKQNTQMARLCDIRDPNVDVIYISAVPLSDETLQYYSKLLGLSSAVASSNPQDQSDMSERYKILVPEAIKSFPAHSMCLSTILKYSPRTLKRIKNLIKGRDAYMVTGIPHKDDLAVADALDVPILCPEPDVAHLYSTKSGCKRILASSNIDIPPAEYDVYSLGQLHECLAQLVTENLGVQRWLFKLDDEFDGRGIAYCDVAQYLRCYKWARKEEQRYGEKWSKKWAQESAYIKIHAEIPDILSSYAQPVNTKVFPDWDAYLKAFLAKGGIIEACPPSENITTLTADLLIEPSGLVNILTCGDQVHAESQFSCWGLSVPQSSTEPSDVNAVCNRIAEACKTRGIMGYMRIDLVTFIDPKTMDQKIWAIDLCLHYSDNLAMFSLMAYVTHGTFQSKTHVYEVQLPNTDKPRRRRLVGQEDDQKANNLRYAVMSTRLLHTNLSVVHYSVFFQMCRAHGIGYDIKDKTGTVFTLVDSFNRERLGMLTVGDNLQGALATFARNLSVIHQEISAPNMQGVTNFKSAIADIESILGTTVQNAEDSQEKPEEKDKLSAS
ncbi:IQ domain-containing protein H-like isoform X2 [Physella acuta]|uniref:IQ domain-containing protein H-like isoform X2 n=1 Tax=Physella acuta TaxID=109671 RepID=UPI0027DE3D30|nr:IQ domain-containing protein H-like isoform X2 [Physella acuta]